MAVKAPGLMTVLKSKAAVSTLATVLVLGAGTGTAAAAANGAFGQQVKEQVQDCKAQLTTGVHGIGACVSDFAQRHDPQHQQQHSQSDHGKSSSSHGKPSDPGSSGNHGKPTGTPGNSGGHGRP